MPPGELTGPMLLVLGVIALCMFLFITEWLRVDLVALLVMVALPLLGLVGGNEAFAGLGSNAVVSVIAVIILGAGLDRTGVINQVVGPVTHLAGQSARRMVVLLSLTMASVSSVMQNVGAAALFLPAIRRVCRQSGVAISQVLMPVGFMAILGGTITLVGSSPLILLNDLLTPMGLEPFGLFAVTPVGFCLVAAGVLYFLFLGRWVLPARPRGRREAGAAFDPLAYYHDVGELFELEVPAREGELPRVRDLSEGYMVQTVALSLDGGQTKLIPPNRNTRLAPGSVLAVYGRRRMVVRLAQRYGLVMHGEPATFAAELSPLMAGLVEAVVPPHSRVVGRTLAQIGIRSDLGVAPLAVTRGERVYYAGLSDLPLRPGNGILMFGRWERILDLREARDLIFAHPLNAEVIEPHKAYRAIFCFALATALVAFTPLKLSVCLMTGAVGLILTRVLTIDEAYRAVDWRTVFLLAGLIPLGLATEKTGTAAFLAQSLLAWLGAVPPLVLYGVVGLITSLLTLVVSNVGATVLLVPLAATMAREAGADPRLAALVVGLCASNSFLLPTHQVNALYLGPGGYQARDFLRAGGGMSLIFLVVTTLVLALLY